MTKAEYQKSIKNSFWIKFNRNLLESMISNQATRVYEPIISKTKYEIYQNFVNNDHE